MYLLNKTFLYSNEIMKEKGNREMLLSYCEVLKMKKNTIITTNRRGKKLIELKLWYKICCVQNNFDFFHVTEF